MARAFGSYPECQRFESTRRYQPKTVQIIQTARSFFILFAAIYPANGLHIFNNRHIFAIMCRKCTKSCTSLLILNRESSNTKRKSQELQAFSGLCLKKQTLFRVQKAVFEKTDTFFFFATDLAQFDVKIAARLGVNLTSRARSDLARLFACCCPARGSIDRPLS